MGKLIVLEGTDGSGKATQTAALLERLQREHIDCRKIEFPRYQEESSALIREYLRGDLATSPRMSMHLPHLRFMRWTATPPISRIGAPITGRAAW